MALRYNEVTPSPTPLASVSLKVSNRTMQNILLRKRQEVRDTVHVRQGGLNEIYIPFEDIDDFITALKAIKERGV